MLTTEDATFLEALESRIPNNDWTPEETKRLWGLSSYRTPPPEVRGHYTRSVEHRERLIANAYAYSMRELTARMSGGPTVVGADFDFDSRVLRKQYEKANQ